MTGFSTFLLKKKSGAKENTEKMDIGGLTDI